MQFDSFQVVPALPENLAGLRDMAYNLLWSWDDEVRVIFSRIDPVAWEETNQNPVLMLGRLAQDRLDELSRDPGFLSFYERTWERYQSYFAETTWWDQHYADRPLVAYFSAEFGLAECVPIYSGGLGVLAGHHLKSASDLGVPLVGVGLLYQQGYFHQYLTSDGWQHESYPTNDFFNLPIKRVPGKDSESLRIEVPVGTQRVVAQVWMIEVGRLPLYLLDTNLPENPRDVQEITGNLYGGSHENRLRQEIVLGIGGLRALRALGLRPTVCHMNEGHSAFLSLERIRELVTEHGLKFREALEAARAGNVFTSHTPVPAGIDEFSPDEMDKYFSRYVGEVGITRQELLALGRTNAADAGAPFNMATLAFRTCAYANGVSQLHGKVSRRLFQKLLPTIPEHEIPVTHVTNAAHTRSCISREMAGLCDRYLGADWWRQADVEAAWARVDMIPDEELWATHERRRQRLVAFARRRLQRQLEDRSASRRDIEKARGVLDTRWLTIGFARRFATYKRANLLLADLDRLRRILLDEERPVQIIFAGKAHPQDGPAKEMLKTVFGFCQRDDVRRHALFLEDYDLVIARYLVQGCDVWLNTPRRGMEASGTSGMKVLPNGGLNLSILDGWWCEGFRPEAGWAIGKGEDYDDHTYQDFVESGALYDLLEKDVVPLFYARGVDGLPRRWIARMKASMQLTPAFGTNRMLFEYADRFYKPAAAYHARLSADGFARARELAEWKGTILQHWGEVLVESIVAPRDGSRKVGEGFEVRADLRLGSINPLDVDVELYYGLLDAKRQPGEGHALPMKLESRREDGLYRYVGTVPCERTGMLGYTVRIRPQHPDANGLLGIGLMTWR